VKITVTVDGRAVAVEQLADEGLASALRKAGEDVARKLGGIECPVHHKKASDVRVHFDAAGSADLRYESCCEKLGACIVAALG
jgi:hypothetical protein